MPRRFLPCWPTPPCKDEDNVNHQPFSQIDPRSCKSSRSNLVIEVQSTMRRQLESEMATSLLLTVEASVVKARVSLGKVGGTISTADSEAGNALMLVITNPFGPK